MQKKTSCIWPVYYKNTYFHKWFHFPVRVLQFSLFLLFNVKVYKTNPQFEQKQLTAYNIDEEVSPLQQKEPILLLGMPLPENAGSV